MNSANDIERNEVFTGFFDSRKLGLPRREFVFWLDCMGTQCFMQRSVATSASFIFKFQQIVAQTAMTYRDIHLYPVMDGVYITGSYDKAMVSLVSQIMKKMALLFIHEENIEFRFMVRGAMAYGDVYHGDGISPMAFGTIDTGLKKDSILIGTPVIQANQWEHKAPPFGIAIHDSCKLSGYSFNAEWMDWDRNFAYDEAFNYKDILSDLAEPVNEYFSYYQDQTCYSGYSETKIKEHRCAFEQFLKRHQSINKYEGYAK